MVKGPAKLSNLITYRYVFGLIRIEIVIPDNSAPVPSNKLNRTHLHTTEKTQRFMERKMAKF